MIRYLLILALWLCSPLLSAATFDHDNWHSLLAANVYATDGNSSTSVDYAGFARDRDALQAYLAALSEVTREDFDTWPGEAQLAFLINAYNAWTVELILTRYPGLESIRDLGNLLRSPWKKAIAPLLGKTRSLDDIEHGLIRGSGRYNEPRIHFAVNCASIGCPSLRAQAYTAGQLEEQLEAQTQQFLGDRSRNRLRGDTLELSSIFKWYRDDFGLGWKGQGDLVDFIEYYASALELTAQDITRLRSGDITLAFLDYNWDLNDRT
ncbi:MAG TPA: DUF547 domain-containing protein [Kineobactrum sp.]